MASGFPADENGGVGAVRVTTTTDAFDIVGHIGKGSFGAVAKIRRKADGKILVWKELNYGRMKDKEKALVVSEVNILRNLRHPYIVKYYDRILDKAQSRIYIVMEFCEGGDLGTIIKRCRDDKKEISESFIWRVLAQIITALRECHRHKEGAKLKPILHRDIKPGNIFLDKEQNVKIGDFGLAKELGSDSLMAETNVGTPFYMSPEMVDGRPYNEKSDIWALGCVLFEMAALHSPFHAVNQAQLSHKIKQAKVPRLPEPYSEDLYRAIRWMLELDQDKRPSVEQLEDLLLRTRPAAGMLPAARAVVQSFADLQEAKHGFRGAAAGPGAAPASTAAAAADLAQREAELAKREAAVAAREAAVRAAEKALRERQSQLESRLVEAARREEAAGITSAAARRPSLPAGFPAPAAATGAPAGRAAATGGAAPAPLPRDRLGVGIAGTAAAPAPAPPLHRAQSDRTGLGTGTHAYAPPQHQPAYRRPSSTAAEPVPAAAPVEADARSPSSGSGGNGMVIDDDGCDAAPPVTRLHGGAVAAATGGGGPLDVLATNQIGHGYNLGFGLGMGHYGTGNAAKPGLHVPRAAVRPL